MGQPKVWVALLGTAVIAGSAFFVYPTPYIIAKQGESDFMRLNRFTGVKEYATDKGWRTMERIVEESRSESVAKILREADLNLVAGYTLTSETLNIRYRDGREDLVSAANGAGPIIRQLEAKGIRELTEQLAYK